MVEELHARMCWLFVIGLGNPLQMRGVALVVLSQQVVQLTRGCEVATG
jgi:hypothetical protein